MTNTNTAVPTVAKAKDQFSAEAWLKVCVSDHKAGVRKAGTEAKAWDATGKVLFENGLVEDADGTLNQKDFSALLRENFFGFLQSEIADEIPEVIEKDGVPWKTRKKGVIKWRTLPYTKNQVKYLSTIFNAVYKTDVETVFPKGTLLPKNELDKINKTQETPEKAIERGLKLIDANIDNVTDQVNLDSIVAQLLAVYVRAGEVKDAVEKGEEIPARVEEETQQEPEVKATGTDNEVPF